MWPSAPPSVVVTLGVADTSAIDFDALRVALAVAGGIKDQKLDRPDLPFVTMVVSAIPPTVVRVHLSSADDVKLYEVKQLLVSSFDSKEEAATKAANVALETTKLIDSAPAAMAKLMRKAVMTVNLLGCKNPTRKSDGKSAGR